MALNINHAANFSIPFTSCLIFVLSAFVYKDGKIFGIFYFNRKK